MALQLGLAHPLVVWAARTLLEEPELALVSLPTIIPWVKSVEMISADDDNAYRDGITGSHFAVGGIDQIIIPRQASSLITDVLRLSMAALHVRRSLMCS